MLTKKAKLLSGHAREKCKEISRLDAGVDRGRALALLAVDMGASHREAAGQVGLTIGQVKYAVALFRRKKLAAFSSDLLRLKDLGLADKSSHKGVQTNRKETESVANKEKEEDKKAKKDKEKSKTEKKLKKAIKAEAAKEKEKKKAKKEDGKKKKKADKAEKKAKKSKKEKSDKKKEKDKKPKKK